MPYTSHRAGSIRRAAIRALAKLNRAAHVDIFVEALKDQIPYVSRQALIALTDKTSAIIVGLAWAVFQSAVHPHVKRNALSLIEKVGKWDSIFYLITAVRDSDEAIAAMSRIGIRRWLARSNRSFKLPTPEQLARLGRALEDNGNLLDDRTLEQLRFLMKSIN